MIGVTIGIGNSTWKEVAQRAAGRMSEFTGLDCHVIDDWHGQPYEHPAWMKCRILDLFPKEDSFLYFDSDVWCVKPWKPSGLFEAFDREFIAPLAVNNEFIKQECMDYGIPLGTYICAGLFIFGRKHQPIFEYAESLHPGYGTWYDQTPINVALNKGVNVTHLGQKYCAETHGGKYIESYSNVPANEVINFHFCSCGGDASRVRALQESGAII